MNTRYMPLGRIPSILSRLPRLFRSLDILSATPGYCTLMATSLPSASTPYSRSTHPQRWYSTTRDDQEKKWESTSMDLTDRCGSDGDRIEFLYSRSPIMAEFMVHDILDGSVRSSEIYVSWQVYFGASWRSAPPTVGPASCRLRSGLDQGFRPALAGSGQNLGDTQDH